ncbi:MAG: hypothetical protein Sylvanvirus3_27 [Sylvanvirus sp.]|uniref:Uncharacterized protein n=1 Tax=Sylvanvirus sp. TaxID=2487774 RepID=A0A3G5AK76_9VIRU|nr:MAG: hypothetical protein Sylvanvirus3_27 [Sylvanvirus sp.]
MALVAIANADLLQYLNVQSPVPKGSLSSESKSRTKKVMPIKRKGGSTSSSSSSQSRSSCSSSHKKQKVAIDHKRKEEQHTGDKDNDNDKNKDSNVNNESSIQTVSSTVVVEHKSTDILNVNVDSLEDHAQSTIPSAVLSINPPSIQPSIPHIHVSSVGSIGVEMDTPPSAECTDYVNQSVLPNGLEDENLLNFDVYNSSDDNTHVHGPSYSSSSITPYQTDYVTLSMPLKESTSNSNLLDDTIPDLPTSSNSSTLSDKQEDTPFNHPIMSHLLNVHIREDIGKSSLPIQQHSHASEPFKSLTLDVESILLPFTVMPLNLDTPSAVRVIITPTSSTSSTTSIRWKGLEFDSDTVVCLKKAFKSTSDQIKQTSFDAHESTQVREGYALTRFEQLQQVLLGTIHPISPPLQACAMFLMDDSRTFLWMNWVTVHQQTVDLLVQKMDTAKTTFTNVSDALMRQILREVSLYYCLAVDKLVQQWYQWYIQLVHSNQYPFELVSKSWTLWLSVVAQTSQISVSDCIKARSIRCKIELLLTDKKFSKVLGLLYETSLLSHLSSAYPCVPLDIPMNRQPKLQKQCHTDILTLSNQYLDFNSSEKKKLCRKVTHWFDKAVVLIQMDLSTDSTE